MKEVTETQKSVQPVRRLDIGAPSNRPGLQSNLFFPSNQGKKFLINFYIILYKNVINRLAQESIKQN